MKQQINEIKRMQQLAGIISESQLSEDMRDELRIRAIAQNIKKDIKNGEVKNQDLKLHSFLEKYAKDTSLKLKTFITKDEVENKLYDMLFGPLEMSDYEYPESEWR